MTVDIDPITQTNYTQIATTHVHLDWTVDFEAKRIVGNAIHTFDVKEDGLKEVMYVLIYATYFYLSYISARNKDTLITDAVYRLDAFGLEIEKIEVEGHAAKVLEICVHKLSAF